MSIGKIAIGIGVVYVLYRVYKKNKTEEPFVLDDDIKTSNATGCSGGLIWCEFSQSCTTPAHCQTTRKK